MPLVVHHYFPLGSSNIGDLLVAHALRQAFVRHFGPTRFVDMPANDRYRGHDRPIGLRGLNVEYSNREADLVLVGGSNMLEARKVPRRPKTPGMPTWGVFTDLPSLARLRPPLLLAGMGTGSSFGKRVRAYSLQAREEIRGLHAQAIGAAVRDVTTVQCLARIGVRSECTGCPVTFLTDRPIRPQPCDLPLLVSFPPARIIKRWGGKMFMRLAMQYIAWLQRRKVPLVVTLHEDSDLDVVHDWVPGGVEVFHTRVLGELIDRFEASRGVIGFRLHAALLGLGLGKPVIPVGTDWRGRAFIETFELDDLSIRPFRWGQLKKLCVLTERLLSGDPELHSRLDERKTYYRRRGETFFAGAATRLTRLRRAG
jgi:hypothetical protein